MSLLEALANATRADLDAVEARLAELAAEAKSLDVVRRVLAVRLGTALPASGGSNGGRPSGPNGSANVRKRAAAVLAAGPMRNVALAEVLDVKPKTLHNALSTSDWFTLVGEGWALTPAGRQAN